MITKSSNHSSPSRDHRPLYGVFFVKVTLLSALIFLGLAVKTYYFWRNDKYQETISGREIYWAIKKSEQRQKVDEVLLGDSVAQQLYDNRHFNRDPFSLACNQSISCVGYYLLLKQFLETNADQLPKRVVLLIHPETLRNNLDQVYTFHYFLKPFDTAGNRQYFSPIVDAQIHKIPFYFTSQYTLVKTSNWSPDFTPTPQNDQDPVAPVSIEYLSKIKALCEHCGISFCMIPVPVRASLQPKIELNRAKYLRQAASIGMQREFDYYLHRSIALDDALFSDGTHFRNPDDIRTRYVEIQRK
jgi:hypothetical protein